MAAIDLKLATFKIKDGSSVPNSLTVILGEGNLTYEEKKNRQYMKDRGKLGTVRDGDEEPIDVSFDFRWDFLKASSGDPPTVEDALKGRGGATTWKTTDTDTCAPYAVDIEVEYTPICDTEDKETIVLSDFRWESLSHDPKAGTVSCKGKCNITEAAITRTAQE